MGAGIAASPHCAERRFAGVPEIVAPCGVSPSRSWRTSSGVASLKALLLHQELFPRRVRPAPSRAPFVFSGSAVARPTSRRACARWKLAGPLRDRGGPTPWEVETSLRLSPACRLRTRARGLHILVPGRTFDPACEDLHPLGPKPSVPRPFLGRCPLVAALTGPCEPVRPCDARKTHLFRRLLPALLRKSSAPSSREHSRMPLTVANRSSSIALPAEIVAFTPSSSSRFRGRSGGGRCPRSPGEDDAKPESRKADSTARRLWVTGISGAVVRFAQQSSRTGR
jgi:hypothetical protein